MKRVSLKDVADSLGVSQTLVSFVINGKTEEKGISKATAERVMEKVKELNYRPNSFARILRTGISKTIGVVVADISNPFYARIGRNIEDYVSQYGYKVIFCSSDENAEKEKAQLQMLVERGIDGIILAPTREFSEEIDKELKELEIPVILIDRYYKNSDYNYVTIDNYSITRELTQYLIDKGHKKIGYLSLLPVNTSTMRERLDSFLNTLEENGIENGEDLVMDFELRKLDEQMPVQMENLLKKDITAIISTNNKITISSIYNLYQKGIGIPEDISFVSFDYLDAFKIMNPPLNSVQLFAEDIGDNAARMLLSKMSKPKEPIENVMIQAKFHIEKSVKKIN